MIYSSIFGELTKNVQVRFDAASELHKRLFDNVIYEQYLDWDAPTIGLEFEELIGQYNITIAAPTIGNNSKEPIMGTEGLQSMREKILRHAIGKSMTTQEYRKVLQLLDSKSINDSVKTQQLVNLMFKQVEDVVNSVRAKLDVMFLQGLSNGKCELNDENNPEGGVKGVINYNQPTENIASAKNAWNDTNKDTVDVFEDVQGVIDAAQDKVVFSKILCDPSLISYMCRTKKMHQLIHGNDKSARMVQLRDINEYMQSNGFPIFEPIRRQVRIQNGVERKPMSPWNKKNMVFIPDGKLGVIKNAYADSELKPENGVAYSNFGRIRVSQWGVGETQGSNGVEFVKAEAYALPVITEMNGIYTLKTQE